METLKYTLCAILTLLAIGTHAQNNPPVANDDVDSTGSGNGGIIFVLNNDTDPDGNTLSVDTVLYNPNNSTAVVLGATVINYTSNMDFYGSDTLYYVVSDDTIPSLSDTGMVIVEVTYVMYESYEYLDINMVKARFNANGSDFWNQGLGNAWYEVPKGGGKHTLFLADMWIGGKDDQDSLHLAAARYNGGGQDIYTGPIMDTSAYSFSQDSLWNRLWKVNKSTIDSHKVNWQSPGYTPAEVIATWPGNGNTSLGQAALLAPFYDRNGDQVYDPYDGDYPEIRGDQAVYFIRNDHRGPHNESFGGILKIEIHGMAYAYDCSEDPALNYTTFIHYKVVNRSSNNYSDTYIGINIDPDIGDYSDDYIGCDVMRGSVFGYNGPNIDGTGAPQHYGQYPPAQGLVYLKGPLMEPDGIDNAAGSCDASVNGYGFGDAIIDNEALGLTHFTYYCNPGIGGCNGATQGDPVTADQYYNLMMSKWKDGSTMVYGGNGHINNCTSCEPTNFMFPDVSDTCNWGTGGITPADTMPWNEQNSGNFPNDRRGITSAGPFTFSSGDTIELDIAYVFGRDSSDTNAYAGVVNMNERIDSVRSYFSKDQTPCGSFFLGEDRITNQTETTGIQVHPNPAGQYVSIANLPPEANRDYQVCDFTGRIVLEGKLDQRGTVDIGALRSGAYIITLPEMDTMLRAKFIKL